MKAPPTSQTVELAKPEKAHFTDSLASLNPSLACSSVLNSSHFDKTAVRVMAMMPTAVTAMGSTTSAVTTPENNEKKYQACWARPCGAGADAKAKVTANGSRTRHQTMPWASSLMMTPLLSSERRVNP